MNVNKKLGRIKQWGKERMGGEVKTDTNEEFKALESEMQLRSQGMDKLKRSTDAYIQSLSKREKYQDKEQQLAVGFFGSSMVSHGDDFEPDSEYGQCLSTLGRANERIARMQETYCANATSSWLESLERSLVQMKEYQRARKQLDSRRLAYDTASTKMQKSKKEDFKMEEELRSQKMKYEESSEDVFRRMLDIKEAEVESVQDLTSFLEAELTYYDRCREVLMQVKRDWPAATGGSRTGASSPANGAPIRRINTASTVSRSRASSFARAADDEYYNSMPPPQISSRIASGQNSPRRELPGFDLPTRPSYRTASSNFEGPTSLGGGRDQPSYAREQPSYNRDFSPAPSMPRLERVQTDSSAIHGARLNLRPTRSRNDGQATPGGDSYGGDYSDDSHSSYSEHPQRTPSWSTTALDGGSMVKKAAPPPVPSRSKKPPPPPPPMKRSALSSSEVPGYR
ncbi:unnamed protein product [Zymoseptoria tritici ST99CH_1E4]|uniref:BAR domain-containing protein n=1 Tax=Zymoseptoria tritici ST99CH_1E4 TaxID=1276532 RepID=A0A2H1GTN2_ZYMTR|nr:unnamed protein product [Zymoseptoria tritici ST99CH_1E4]